jgi:hypothetical protein
MLALLPVVSDLIVSNDVQITGLDRTGRFQEGVAPRFQHSRHINVVNAAFAPRYSKTCLKRHAIIPVFFFSVFTAFRFTKGCVLIKQSTKNMIA